MRLLKFFSDIAGVFVDGLLPHKKHQAIMQHTPTEVLQSKIRPTVSKGHIALLPYADQTVKHFLYAVKSRHRKSVAFAGDILLTHIHKEMEQRELHACTLCIVPASENRKHMHGYNYLHAVLDVLHTASSNSQLHDGRTLLRWVRHTHQQRTLKKSDRFANVHNAMRVIGTPPSQTTCFVIDDITTTGATLNESRRALVAGGATSVVTLALAH